jgi:hypothetical protein
MIINKKRILNLDSALPSVQQGKDIVIGLKNLDRFEQTLTKLGFITPLAVGTCLLPSAKLGPICKFNAEGKYLRHKDRQMETVTRVQEWERIECHGQDRIPVTDFVDVPYKRYPRTFILPYAEELTALRASDGNLVIVSKPIRYLSGNKEELKHTINLFLELFKECQIFSDDLEDIVKAPLKRVNWKVLPPGHLSWEQMKTALEPIVQQATKGKRSYIWHRLEKIAEHKPDFAAYGLGGFNGYFVMGFETKNTFVCESCLYGNATYVFDDNWEKLSQKTKTEILNSKLQKDRIIHKTKEWERRINTLLA